MPDLIPNRILTNKAGCVPCLFFVAIAVAYHAALLAIFRSLCR